MGARNAGRNRDREWGRLSAALVPRGVVRAALAESSASPGNSARYGMALAPNALGETSSSDPGELDRVMRVDLVDTTDPNVAGAGTTAGMGSPTV